MVIFPCVFSNNALSTVTNVIHFECSVQLVARMNQPRYAIHDSLVACNLLHERFNLGACLTISTIYDFVQQVARYDLRPNHTRNEIKRGDFSVCFFKQRIINRQERYSFRATSCTLRFTIPCNELHATEIILDINFVF